MLLLTKHTMALATDNHCLCITRHFSASSTVELSTVNQSAMPQRNPFHSLSPCLPCSAALYGQMCVVPRDCLCCFTSKTNWKVLLYSFYPIGCFEVYCSLRVHSKKIYLPKGFFGWRISRMGREALTQIKLLLLLWNHGSSMRKNIILEATWVTKGPGLKTTSVLRW